jgi:hypothetical protein
MLVRHGAGDGASSETVASGGSSAIGLATQGATALKAGVDVAESRAAPLDMLIGCRSDRDGRSVGISSRRSWFGTAC